MVTRSVHYVRTLSLACPPQVCPSLVHLSEKISDAEIEESLEKVVQLFAFITDKDMFGEMYRQVCAHTGFSCACALQIQGAFPCSPLAHLCTREGLSPRGRATQQLHSLPTHASMPPRLLTFSGMHSSSHVCSHPLLCPSHCLEHPSLCALLRPGTCLQSVC